MTSLARKTMPVAHCRSCNAAIFWCVNARTGKTGPVDVKPTDGGNLQVDYATGTYRLVPKAERSGPLYLSHFVTCPHASRHHKKESV